MGYKKAEDVLPERILKLVQKYVDGEIIYIPRKGEKRSWGSETRLRDSLKERNVSIYKEYLHGKSTEELAESYYLSKKSIQRILREYTNLHRIDLNETIWRTQN
ncbi:MAG TPA: CD3324 family protein [Lachnospiraceae bacterium]|nr:CD3324 family protein [Lachnospiraceae bacterium]